MMTFNGELMRKLGLIDAKGQQAPFIQFCIGIGSCVSRMIRLFCCAFSRKITVNFLLGKRPDVVTFCGDLT